MKDVLTTRPGHLIWKAYQKSWITNSYKGTKEEKNQVILLLQKQGFNEINSGLKRKKSLNFKSAGQKFF